MKKRYLITLLTCSLFMFGAVKAQTNLTQAVDFTVTDIDGNVHNLFDILNGGQHVCIDFFFDTCGPCQVTSPYFKQTYTNFGCNSEDIFFIAIDLGDTDAEVVAYENTFLGGSPGYPSVSGLDGNSVINAYGIGAFPTYILIQPDQTIIEQDMWPISDATTFTSYFGTHNLLPVACSTVGINEDVIFEGTSVFPNPASDMISVKTDLQVDQVRIFNLLGEEVYSEISGSKNSSGQINISSFDSGLYMIELISGNNSARYRFAKQ